MTSDSGCGCEEKKQPKVKGQIPSDSERCKHTRILLYDITADDLFKDQFHTVLSKAIASQPKVGEKVPLSNNQLDLIRDVIKAFEAYDAWKRLSLRELFSIPSSSYATAPGIEKALKAANKHFMMPFFTMPDCKRADAAAFLADQQFVEKPNPPKNQVFLDAFGDYKMEELFGSKLRDLHLWQQHLLGKAITNGIIRELPKAANCLVLDDQAAKKLADVLSEVLNTKIEAASAETEDGYTKQGLEKLAAQLKDDTWALNFARQAIHAGLLGEMSKGECARYTTNGWKCQAGENDDVCGLDPSGQPLAGTTFC